MPPPAPTFSCPACAKRFVWKPAFAGRTITCKCGHLFEPSTGDSATPSLAKALEESSPYDADESLNSPPSSDLAAPAPAVARAAPPPIDGRFLVPRARPQFEEEPEDGSLLKRLHAPVVLIALGLALSFVYPLLLPPRRSPGAGQLLGWEALVTVLGLTTTMIGVLAAAKVMAIQYGSLGPVLLKLTGIALFAVGLASTIVGLDTKGSVVGPIVALHAVVIFYWAAFSFLFSMELQETMMTVAIITLLQAIMACAAYLA